MTNDEILEGNKLIADSPFSDLVKGSGEEERWYIKSNNQQGYFTELKYHSSWDWIMPACSKWDNLYFDVLEIKTREQYELRCDSLDNAVTRYELAPVFKQLVENIKWYNKNKTDESK